MKKYPYNVNYCGRKQQEQMIARGWRLKLSRDWEESVNADKLYDRLSQEWKQVKIYYDTTAVRGLHNNFAFVKDRIWW